MAIIVQKYGGSSVADVEKIQRVADKVVHTAHAGHQVVVVVSAMAKTTDGLIELARQVASHNGQAAPAPRRELDMLVTTGERVSMALLSIAIHARGLDAISFTGSQCGIMTNDRHFDARIIEVRPHRVEDELARGRVVIVAGYQGVSYKREITTLGRGGSDTTAVALAAALGAERCEIYSDVDGVYSADPHAVPAAQHMPEIDSAVLQEMAECGAKVLNAQAVEWARRSNVAIYARSTFGSLHASGEPTRETIVRKLAPSQDNRVRAVVAEPNAALLTLRSGISEIAAASRQLADLGLPIRDLAISSFGASLLVPLANVPEWNRAQELLKASPVWSHATLHDRVGVVSLVGDGLGDSAIPLQRAVGALQDNKILSLDVRASALRLSLVVPAESLGLAQRILHAQFIEQDDENRRPFPAS